MNSDEFRGSPSPSALDIARRLLAPVGTWEGEAEAEAAGKALQRICSGLVRALRDSMGEEGCTALLARALARTDTTHKALRDIRRLDGDQILLDGVVAALRIHGPDKVMDGIEALLAALVDILIQLIGEDMAVRLVDDGVRPGDSGRARAP